jgi:hypothetical protein
VISRAQLGLVPRLALTAVPLLGGAVLAPGRSFAATSIQSRALSSGDVQHFFGSGFKEIASTAISARSVDYEASLEKLPGISYAAHGFVSGYLSAYSRTQNLTTYKNGKLTVNRGVVAVTAAVMSFKNTTGPRWEITYVKAHPDVSRATHSRTKSVSGLGDAAVMTTTSTNIAVVGKVDTLELEWRRGAYVVTLLVSGYGSINTSKTMKVAKALDARVR